MRLQYSAFVESDLEAIGAYIARHNPERAATFAEELLSEIQRVGQAPFSFRLRPDIAPTARAATLGNYVILFKVDGEVVRIVRVAQGSRNLSEIYSASATDL